MRECEIEQYFVKRCREAGILQRKFVSPGHRDVMDRITVFKGDVHFVEIKAPGKFLRPGQMREHAKFRIAGAKVWTIDSIEGVEYFIEKVTK
jgi:hypothetical protein